MSSKHMTKKILVADDDPAILDALQMMLELEGYEVITTVDGETIYKMEKEYPDLLLLDIWMSGQDGRDICKYLKKDPHTKHIPQAGKLWIQQSKLARMDLYPNLLKWMNYLRWLKNISIRKSKLAPVNWCHTMRF